jgi:hypothetical protein
LFATIGAYQAARFFDPPPSRSAGVNTDSPVPTSPIPEFRDATGVVWRSTNQEHVGLVSVDANGVVRLEKSAELADNWAMVEGVLVGLPTTHRYLLLDIVELSAGSDVSWTAKLAPPDGSNRDIELNYGHEAGQFAFLVPEQTGTASSKVRIFIVGSDGAFVRFRDVRLADAIPDEYRELSVLPGK